MGCLLALSHVYLAYLVATAIGSERQEHRVQHGPCSYTFILPEVEHCHPLKDFQVTNTLQGDSPPEAEPASSQSKQVNGHKERPSWQERKLESLESAMENNTQWLQKVICKLFSFSFCHKTIFYPFTAGLSSSSPFKMLHWLQNVEGKKITAWPHNTQSNVDKLSLLISSVLSWDFLDACIWLHDSMCCTSVGPYLRTLGYRNSLLHASGKKEVRMKKISDCAKNVSHTKTFQMSIFCPRDFTID